MKIADILHIAKLSKLKLTPEELANYPARFEEIMKMINVIAEADTHGIKPMHNPFDQELEEAVMREDVITANPTGSLILTSQEDPYFYVPKVIE